MIWFLLRSPGRLLAALDQAVQLFRLPQACALGIVLAISACVATEPVGEGPDGWWNVPAGLRALLRQDLPRRYLTADGKLIWPPASGFSTTSLKVILQPGQLLDRFGRDDGTFLSVPGSSFASRALPYRCDGVPYTTYKVIKPLQVDIGAAAPWFGDPGGAPQIMTAAPISALPELQKVESENAAGTSPCTDVEISR